MRLLRVAASIFVLALLAGFALAFSVYQCYSDLAELNRVSKSRFADWEATLAPRRAMLAELAEMARVYEPAAGEIAARANDALAESSSGSNVEARIRMHLLYGKAMRDLRSTAARFPQLTRSDVYREWISEREKDQILEEAARLAYNTAARDYNAVLNTFSGKLISLIYTVPPKPEIPAGD
ncbi:LemA family protein [bacterium]|nr:LemA family protein [bacterium]